MVSETPTPGGVRAGGFGVRALIRSYFSTRLLWAAFHATDKAQQFEDAHDEEGEPAFDLEHNAYVLSAIVSSGAFLEAAVNEFFQDAHDEHGLEGDGYLAPLDASTVKGMAAVWKGTADGSRVRPLEKWQLMLILAGKEPLARGAAPYQDAQRLIDLRNVILHYRPEHVGADEVHKIEVRLKHRFPENRLMAKAGNPWWPDKCLGYGCAEWSARSAVAFADHVCHELGIRANYRRIAEGDWMGKTPQSWGRAAS